MASVSTGNQDKQGDQENVIVGEPATTSSEEDKQEDEEELILEPSDVMWSPVFKLMFTVEFKEKYSQEITLPGKKAHEIKEMLLVMYPTTMKPISEENCYFLLPLAEEYQMALLKEKCEKYLLDAMKDFKRLDDWQKVQKVKKYWSADLLILSQDYSLETLLKCCKTEMATLNLKHIMGYPRYEEITDKNLRDIHIARIQNLEQKTAMIATPERPLVQFRTASPFGQSGTVFGQPTTTMSLFPDGLNAKHGQ